MGDIELTMPEHGFALLTAQIASQAYLANVKIRLAIHEQALDDFASGKFDITDSSHRELILEMSRLTLSSKAVLETVSASLALAVDALLNPSIRDVVHGIIKKAGGDLSAAIHDEITEYGTKLKIDGGLVGPEDAPDLDDLFNKFKNGLA